MTQTVPDPDLIADIIAAHASGGITPDLCVRSWTTGDDELFVARMAEADPVVAEALEVARRPFRPLTRSQKREIDIAARADPDTVAALDELMRWLHSEAEPAAPDGWPIASADDIAAVIDGSYERPRPELLMRTDGHGMMYRGRVHSLAGEPGGGKTWLALYAVKQVLDNGGRCLFLDFEDRLDTAVRRLVQLGCTGPAIVAGLTYSNPTLAIKGGGLPTNIVDISAGADLVVIDSMGEALAHSDMNQNDDGEVRNWMTNTARRLADAGACVLILDHVSKDADNRGRWAIGSQRKLAAIDGIAYMASTIVAASHSQSGHIVVKCSKDRLGNFQHGTNVADIRINPIGSDVEIIIDPPKDTTTESGEHLLTGYMEKVSRFLETDDDGWSKNAIHGTVAGKKDHINTAIQQLVDLGFVEVVKGPNRAVIHRVKTPYREPEIVSSPVRPRFGPGSAQIGAEPGPARFGPSAPPLGGPNRKGPNGNPGPSIKNDVGSAPKRAEPDDLDFDYPF